MEGRDGRRLGQAAPLTRRPGGRTGGGAEDDPGGARRHTISWHVFSADVSVVTHARAQCGQ